jgi:hypothetical protein
MLPDPRIMLAATVAILATIVALGLGALDALRHHADREWAGSLGGLRSGLAPSLSETSASPDLSQMALNRRLAELRALREFVVREENAIVDPPVQPAAAVVDADTAVEPAAPAEAPIAAIVRSDKAAAEPATDMPAAASAATVPTAEVASGPDATSQSGPTSAPAAAPAAPQQVAVTARPEQTDGTEMDKAKAVQNATHDAAAAHDVAHDAHEKAAKIQAATKQKRKAARAHRARRTVQTAATPAAAPSNNFFLFGSPSSPTTVRR